MKGQPEECRDRDDKEGQDSPISRGVTCWAIVGAELKPSLSLFHGASAECCGYRIPRLRLSHFVEFPGIRGVGRGQDCELLSESNNECWGLCERFALGWGWGSGHGAVATIYCAGYGSKGLSI